MANIDKIKVNGTTYNIIDTTSGYITSANDIYWCTYGTTTSAEIETAINAGKCPMVKYNNYTYTLRYRNSSTNHRFVCNYGGKEYSVVCQSGTWMPDGTLTFLTSAPVTSVNSKTGAVSLTATDVDALPDTTVIPTNVSELTNDSGYLTSTDVARVALVGEYNALIGKPDLTEYKCIVLTSSSFSSLPQTLSNANLTADHVVINSVLSNPSAQTGDWTVTTSSGSLSISGSISGSTTITLYLIEQR